MATDAPTRIARAYDVVSELMNAIELEPDPDKVAELVDKYLFAVADDIDAYCAILSRLKANTAALKQVKTDIQRRYDRAQRTEQRLRAKLLAYLVQNESLTGQSKVAGVAHTAYLQRRKKVSGPDDARQWPERFQVVSWRPDKTAARNALAAGETFDGLELVETVSVGVR